ncbi:MAG: hypothetical protein NWF05_10865 [Candidatus Bathyarchaeota archaeon]|nr:hypothetical protein [Candidatus Bathyarchaeota archaeon]
MTKTDEVLRDLRIAFADYLNSFFPFDYENQTCRLVDNYVASPWIRCDSCGNYPIQAVSVIRSSDGQEMRVGNKCIDQITRRKVSDWFKELRTKQANVTLNRRYIDGIASILTAYRNNELPFQISKDDVERLQKALERMCNGFNPTRAQAQLSECYIRQSAGATTR